MCIQVTIKTEGVILDFFGVETCWLSNSVRDIILLGNEFEYKSCVIPMPHHSKESKDILVTSRGGR
jgi:hypothetical protein